MVSRILRRISLGLAVGFSSAYLATEYVGTVILCEGHSMNPTIIDGDIVITDAVIIQRRIKRGDVVVSIAPRDPTSKICKRVTRVEGDAVSWQPDYPALMPRLHVPTGHIWLEGDNRNYSTDSRSFGPVPLGLVTGRVCFRVWPPSRFGILPSLEGSHDAQCDNNAQ